MYSAVLLFVMKVKSAESKIQEIMAEAKERIERGKLLGTSEVQKQINYFLEESSDETDDND